RGSKWCGWHPGQCSQPSPDPVRRTVAPVATIRTSIAALATASRRNAESDSARPRRRESGCAPTSIAGTVSAARERSAERDARAVLDGADPGEEEPGARELGLERRPLLAGQRDEQPAGGLRVEGELDELLGDVPDLERRVRAVRARARRRDARARGVERAV